MLCHKINQRLRELATFNHPVRHAGVSEEQYAKFSDFKRRVIVPAVKEINQKSDIDVVSWEALRKGRKVTGIRFSCKRKDQMELNWG